MWIELRTIWNSGVNVGEKIAVSECAVFLHIETVAMNLLDNFYTFLMNGSCLHAGRVGKVPSPKAMVYAGVGDVRM